MFETDSPHDRVEMLIAEVKVSIGPGSWIRGDQGRCIVSDTKVGKPPKAEPLRHTRRHAFEAPFIIRSMNGVDELLKDVFDRLHRSRLISVAVNDRLLPNRQL